jgi:hypothetical protein
VDFLIINHPRITLNAQISIKIRRLINHKRIIISNVSPAIPNDDIISQLKYHNIQILSQITHINAGFNITELAHILSFRRQVYINPDDFRKLLNSLLINHENTPHRIFLSDDTLSCYLCKLKGHTSKQYKNPPSEAPNTKLYEAPFYNKSSSNYNVTDDIVEINNPTYDTLGDSKININTTIIVQTLIPPSLLDAPLTMEVTTEDNLVLTPITTDAKKRPALTSTSSSTTADSPSPNSTLQDTVPNDINLSKPNTTNTSKPATKKLKRNKSVENIILKLNEILKPTKTRF